MNEEFTAKKAPVEQLTMPTTDLNPSPVAPQTEDWGMTDPLKHPPDGMKSGGWKMPEPVFRMSDGFCPLKSGKTTNPGEKPSGISAQTQAPPMPDESLANLYEPPDDEAETDVSQHTMHNLSLSDLNLPLPELAPVVSPIAAAPQPNISQEFTVKSPPQVIPPEKKQRSETMRLVFAALGIAAMLAFAAGFLALVYFLFFYKGDAP